MEIFEQKPELFDVSLSFIPTITIFIIKSFIDLIIGYNLSLTTYLIIQIILILSINILSLFILSSIITFKVYWRSNLIANVILIGILISLQNSFYNIKPFGIYLIILGFFHISEYLSTLFFNYKSLNLCSFLLNHSFEYNLAALISWIEFFIEVYFFPKMKTNSLMWLIGILLVIFGEIIRKLAMYTAGSSFNHLVQSKKADDHILIKNGVYSFSRHPSYLGWFYWSIGTQIFLSNPLCIFAYGYASWMFFNSRILAEEFYLIRFFGDEYRDYAKRVPIRIPLIKGYIEHEENLD